MSKKKNKIHIETDEERQLRMFPDPPEEKDKSFYRLKDENEMLRSSLDLVRCVLIQENLKDLKMNDRFTVVAWINEVLKRYDER